MVACTLQCTPKALSGEDGTLVRFYLWVSVPLLLFLSIFTAPFQVPDEGSHFLRAVQLSRGDLAPVRAPGGRAAGGFVDSGAKLVVERLGSIEMSTDRRHRFSSADVLTVRPAERSRAPVFAEFSNTVVYAPSAHAVPALVIASARAAGTPPIAWLYLCRLVNAVLAIAITMLALILAREGGLFVLILAMLPMVLFEEASLSADALTIPAALLLSVLTIRLVSGARFGRRHHGALMLSFLLLIVGKLAYLPLVCLPTLAAFFCGAPRRRIAALGFTMVVTVAIWAIWASIIRHDVFTILPPTEFIDAEAQQRFIAAHPLRYAGILVRSILSEQGRLIELVGGKLGWRIWDMPGPITLLLFAMLLVSALVSPRPARIPPAFRALVLLVLGLTCAVVYTSMYQVFTAVGADRIEGVQGRYLIPLVAFVPLLFPAVTVPDQFVSPLRRMLLASICASSFSMIVVVLVNGWHV